MFCDCVLRVCFVGVFCDCVLLECLVVCVSWVYFVWCFVGVFCVCFCVVFCGAVSYRYL